MKLNLTIQKYILFTSLLLIYTGLIYSMIIYPAKNCNDSRNSVYEVNFNLQQPLYCIVYNYLTFIYNIILFIIILITVFASYKIKNDSTNLYWEINNNCPGVMIFIPCYNESKETINKTLESVLNENYLTELKTMFIVVDGKVKSNKNDSETYLYLLQILGISEEEKITINYSSNILDIYFGYYNSVKYILIIKEENMSKKDSFVLAQKYLNIQESLKDNEINTVIDMYNNDYIRDHLEYTFTEIQNYFNCEYSKYLLIIDTDTEIMNGSLHRMVMQCEKDSCIIGTCGETIVNNKFKSILAMSQVFEYWVSHITLKCLETVFGNVLVLSGCLSLYRSKLLCNKQLIEEYTKTDIKNNVYHGNLYELGEDRFLTNLLLKYNPDMKTVYTEAAKCKTDVPESYNVLLCQRRRWTNSLIFCNIMMLLNTPRYNILQKIIFRIILLLELYLCFIFPLLISLSIYNIVYNIINGFVVVVLIQTIIFICAPIVICIISGKLEMILYSIPFIILQPFYSIVIPMYSIFNVDNLKWGKTR